MVAKNRINQKSIHKFTKLIQQTQTLTNWQDLIFNINSENDFQHSALKIFAFQYKNNPVYRKWCDLLNITSSGVKSVHEIPFLPINFFKHHKIISGHDSDKATLFASSSTTSQIPSRHFVSDIKIYEKSFLEGFKKVYGEIDQYCILALLPGYLERKNSSLVYMCNRLINDSKHPLSGFFLNNVDALIDNITELKKKKQKTILVGVSYALMDLADKEIHLDENFIAMETGGMKGTRKELLKSELHEYLKKGFDIKTIHSEYGMTELLSQAYSIGEGKFIAPPWMSFLIRDITDPLTIRSDHKTGGINVIDLANINSCSFIATQDLGRLDNNNQLELMGRYDNSDIRGCNLMIEPN
ncbi:MAG: acyl transferase [Bacteroidetes bacterium]|nr:acyl transferase [Bacteroidota bacterium]